MLNRATVLEINKRKFINNIEKIKEYALEKEIMPVIKSEGYGTYINKCIDIIDRFNIVAVAIVDEAIELRNIGYNKEIFILNQPSIDELDDIYKYNITVGVCDKSFIKSITKPIKIHLEIETGMNRTGVMLDDLDEVIDLIKSNSNITVEGIYTHFSSADVDSDYTNYQINNFKIAIDKLKDIFNLKYIHCSASNGLLNYREDFTNLVRPGIIMYGYESFNGVKDLIDIEPIARLKTKITYLKELNEGESISYSRRFITNRITKVATIPIGYADGFRRSNTNKGYVVINNTKCPIIGSVCMDSCMVDVTYVDNVTVGDSVYIFDNDIVTLEDIASISNTINYEILSTISSRVPRIFIEE